MTGTQKLKPANIAPWIILCFTVGTALFVLGTTIFASFNTHYKSLYLDQWENLGAYWRHMREGRFLDWFLSLHNEHQILIPRLLILIDESIAGGRNYFLVLWIYLNQIVLSVIFWKLLARDGSSLKTRLSVFAFVIICFFSSTQIENFSWGFQVQFVNVYLFAIASFIFLGRYFEEPNWRDGIGVGIFAICASISMSNGLLVWPTLILLFLLNRRFWRFGLLICGIFALNLWLYLSARRLVSHPTDGLFDFEFFQQLMGFFLVYLGNPLGKLDLGFAHWWGGILLTFFLFLGVHVLYRFRYQKDRTSMVLAAFGVFLVGTALVTSFGRCQLGTLHATAERYTTPALLFDATVIVLAFRIIGIPEKVDYKAVVLAVWFLCFGGFFSFVLSKQTNYPVHYYNKNNKKLVALNAIQNNSVDRYFSKHVHPRLKDHVETIEYLIDHPTYTELHSFQQPGQWSDELPEEIGVDITQEFFVNTTAVKDYEDAYIFYGGFKSNRHISWNQVYIKGADGEWCGSGYIVTALETGWPLSEYVRGEDEQYYYGHIHRPTLDEEYTLYFEIDEILYNVGKISSKGYTQALDCDFYPYESEVGAKMSFQVQEADTSWTENGVFLDIPEIDNVQQIYGSWSGNDTFTGNIRIQIDGLEGYSSVYLPYISGPMDPKASIAMVDAETNETLWLFRPRESSEWVNIRFPLNDDTDSVYLIIKERGDGWGQWFGFATPSAI